MRDNKITPVTLRIAQDPAIKDNTTKLMAYVVDPAGNIIETAPIAKNEARLQTTTDALRADSRIYIAAAMPPELLAQATERTLQKASAYEVVKNIRDNFIDIQKIPGGIFLPWFWKNCLVTGQVNKDFLIDGQLRNLPLCNARVHICEVDTELIFPHIPIYRRKIPDWVIQQLGDKFKNLTLIPKPRIPDPIGPISGLKTNLPLNSLTLKNRLQPRVRPSSLPELAPEVMKAMASGSIPLMRQTLTDFHLQLYPYICLWPVFWPWFYSMEELSVVYTDCNGHFESWESTLFEKGGLDIYIWVEVLINGQWVTVYRPPIPCHTWWNYKCKTNLNIKVTDSRVDPCDCGTQGPADAAWFRSIGTSASALHIEQQLNSSIPLQGATLLNAGCTDIIDGIKISPFGSVLNFKMFFGANIFAAGVTHYRWKKTMVADVNQNPVSGSPSIISGNVSRPYLVKLSASHYETHYVQLGAEGTSTDFAYRIPHHNVALEGIPATDIPLSPEWEDIFFDSAAVDSHSMTDGIYRIELELLKRESNGSFTPVQVNKQTFQVSRINDIRSSQDAPDNYLNLVSATKASSYKMYIRIDNAPCVADIHDARLVETGALSGSCGFIRYDNTDQHIHLSFEASHPRNYARFGFGLVKGNNTQATGINPSGYVLSSVGGFTLSGGLYQADFKVLNLLNGCPGQAAFSENLNVYALATDGTNRLYGFDYQDTITHVNYYYDASDINAFALSNT